VAWVRFGQNQAMAADSALLIMDIQGSVVERFAGGSADRLLESIGTAAAAARDHGLLVIYVRVAFRPGNPEVDPNNRNFSSLPQGSFAEDAPGAQIHEGVAPEPGDIVVTKKRVSAFAGSDLDMVLRAQGVRHLVLTGIATSGVVLSTLRQAADLDYALTVLRDGCADGDPEVQRVLLDKVFPRQADVITAAEWILGLDALH
jgi:nicotinamidase-related amidase